MIGFDTALKESELDVLVRFMMNPETKPLGNRMKTFASLSAVLMLNKHRG